MNNFGVGAKLSSNGRLVPALENLVLISWPKAYKIQDLKMSMNLALEHLKDIVELGYWNACYYCFWYLNLTA